MNHQIIIHNIDFWLLTTEFHRLFNYLRPHLEKPIQMVTFTSDIFSKFGGIIWLLTWKN